MKPRGESSRWPRLTRRFPRKSGAIPTFSKLPAPGISPRATSSRQNDRSLRVLGNPVAHSRRRPSMRNLPQVRQDLSYEARWRHSTALREVRQFVAAGGKGANVTVPFKEEAFRLCYPAQSERAERAGAVNTLAFAGAKSLATTPMAPDWCATSRPTSASRWPAKRILLLGAGGAARGVIAPLAGGQAGQPVHRQSQRRQGGGAGAGVFRPCCAHRCGRRRKFCQNRRPAVSISSSTPPRPAWPAKPCRCRRHLCARQLAYDMMYGKGETPFLALARAAGRRARWPTGWACWSSRRPKPSWSGAACGRTRAGARRIAQPAEAHEASSGPLAQVGLLGLIGLFLVWQLWLLGWVLLWKWVDPGTTRFMEIRLANCNSKIRRRSSRSSGCPTSGFRRT
jgi:shikimate dehydrogenase